MGRDDELQPRQPASDAREQLHLPRRVDMQIHLVDHDDALVLVQRPFVRARLADMVQQVADPPQKRSIAVGQGGEWEHESARVERCTLRPPYRP